MNGLVINEKKVFSIVRYTKTQLLVNNLSHNQLVSNKDLESSRIDDSNLINALKQRNYKSGSYDDFDQKAWRIFDDNSKTTSYTTNFMKDWDINNLTAINSTKELDKKLETIFTDNVEVFRNS